MSEAHFSEAGMKFLKGLKRHNDRDWFNERKDVYERELKAPMLAVIEAVNAGLEPVAPEFVRPAQKCMMRIYRDIRFSKNKDPYKTNLAAWWARAGMEKTSGGGFYFQVSATEVMIAAGVYMPEKEQTLAIRRMLVEEHEQYRKLVKAAKGMAPFDGMAMTRVPKGFEPESAAAEVIKQRQWGVSATLPVEVALGTGLVKEIVTRFKASLPLVALLNEPLAPVARKALF